MTRIPGPASIALALVAAAVLWAQESPPPLTPPQAPAGPTPMPAVLRNHTPVTEARLPFDRTHLDDEFDFDLAYTPEQPPICNGAAVPPTADGECNGVARTGGVAGGEGNPGRTLHRSSGFTRAGSLHGMSADGGHRYGSRRRSRMAPTTSTHQAALRRPVVYSGPKV